MKFRSSSAAALAAIVLLPAALLARPVWESRPRAQGSMSNSGAYCSANHDVGRLSMPVTNMGFFGRGLDGQYTADCFTGQVITPCHYPKDSYNIYMTNGSIWVGAVVNRDTLVSTGYDGVGWSEEFHPDQSPFGDMIYRSTIDPTSPRFEGAVSEQDYIAVFSDTCTKCPGIRPDLMDVRPHRPLNVEITQRSYAWSYAYTQDFILFDYSIRNIGSERLREVYIGIFIDGDVYTNLPLSGSDYGRDDLCGFRQYQPAWYLDELCPVDSDLVNMGWTADNDGDLHRPQDYAWLPHITGARIIRTPGDSLTFSFNWWSTNWWLSSMDFGPQARATYRDLGFDNLGTPWGDRNSYHFLRNGERDYDQAMIGTIGQMDATWIPPPAQWIDSIIAGLDSRYLLSVGPFSLDPGQSLPLTMAYVAGMNFHTDPDNHDNLPHYPEKWYENVHFDSLSTNATWAEWIYDNPGVDTDSDGYAGEFTICNLGDDSTLVCDTAFGQDSIQVTCYWDYEAADTVWRKGDGVPDFRGATPPNNPSTYSFINQYGDTMPGLRVYPDVGRIRLVWSGAMAEASIDPFTREYDFEGYRVYLARDNRESSYSVVDSYDRENYSRWQWSYAAKRFVMREPPFSLLELRCLYADSCGDTTWHPDHYPRTQPLVFLGGPKRDDRVYYFEPLGYNRSVLANDPVNATSGISKVYPRAPRPQHVDPDSISVYFPNRDDTAYFTAEGYLKYYEYEYTFETLLPTVEYYVNVTAFDYGFPEVGLPGLETAPALLPRVTHAMPASDKIAAEGLDVFVYPNPYRLDGDYRERGFEARELRHVPPDKTRLIHFVNLPPQCSIKIFSLDGDLIQEVIHDHRPGEYMANHDTWNLISKNMQLVVSGLYYWSVEDNFGKIQIGKLVIIM